MEYLFFLCVFFNETEKYKRKHWRWVQLPAFKVLFIQSVFLSPFLGWSCMELNLFWRSLSFTDKFTYYFGLDQLFGFYFTAQVYWRGLGLHMKIVTDSSHNSRKRNFPPRFSGKNSELKPFLLWPSSTFLQVSQCHMVFILCDLVWTTGIESLTDYFFRHITGLLN